MNILLKQWQGAGERFSIVESLARIQDFLDATFVVIPENLSESPTLDGIRHFSPLLENLRNLSGFLRQERPGKIFTLAGECSGDIAVVSYLAEKYKEDLVVIWIDAHGDLNTNKTSPSSNFHGMPLRLLLGEGQQDFLNELPCFLSPNQIAFFGTRDLDLEEELYIKEHNISVWQELNTKTSEEMINFVKNKKIYIHLDLDVLSPIRFPYAVYKTENGISVDDLYLFINFITDVSEIVGISVVEYDDQEGKYIEEVRKIINKCAKMVENSLLTKFSS